MKTASDKMAQVIESKDTSCLHVVSLPEEMPVNEGLEIIEAGRTRLRMALGIAFVNRMLPHLIAPDERPSFDKVAARASSEPAVLPYVRAALLRIENEELQQGYSTRFQAASNMPTVYIPELPIATFDRMAIEKIAAVISHGR